MIIVSWEEINELCKNLQHQVEKCSAKYIFGVPRGGLIPAVILSHLTGKEFKYVVDVESQQEYIIVDDVNDSGKTLKNIKLELPNSISLCLFERYDTKYKSDFVGKIIENNDWIIMPWENKEAAFDDMIKYIETRSKNAIH